MGRSPCCDKDGVKRGPWTPEEDQKLSDYIAQYGSGSWRSLPKNAGLQRCGKSCRLRWTNYLRPDIIRGEFSETEERTVIQLHALLGNRWSAIASHMPKRTDNEIKNRWNTHIKKKLVQMGIDPATHRPFSGSGCRAASDDRDGKDAAGHRAAERFTYSGSPDHRSLHMMQWESARLEAEARLREEAKQRASAARPNLVDFQVSNNNICSTLSSCSSSHGSATKQSESPNTPLLSTQSFNKKWCQEEEERRSTPVVEGGGVPAVDEAVDGGNAINIEVVDEAMISDIDDDVASSSTVSAERSASRRRDEELLQELQELLAMGCGSPARVGGTCDGATKLEPLVSSSDCSATISEDWQFDLESLLE